MESKCGNCKFHELHENKRHCVLHDKKIFFHTWCDKWRAAEVLDALPKETLWERIKNVFR